MKLLIDFTLVIPVGEIILLASCFILAVLIEELWRRTRKFLGWEDEL